jgi:hypothetical protein
MVLASYETQRFIIMFSGAHTLAHLSMQKLSSCTLKFSWAKRPQAAIVNKKKWVEICQQVSHFKELRKDQ